MRSSQPHTASFQQSMLRSPEPTGTLRRPSSIDRFAAGRSIVSNNPLDIPVDPQARYSISYVPGMSEHVVNTGKTLPEAQLRVVLLACEVERLNTLNYNLVKENEILKSQTKKTDRENDLETKLAIVLAENEKLNQIVEELHAVYARGHESANSDEYERRISELLQDLEEWKTKYSRLESSNIGNAEHMKAIHALEDEREALREQLGRQGRDLEALRARLASIQVGPTDVKLLQEQISTLKVQNESLKTELDTMKLKYGNADALQQRLNQYDAKLRVLLTENDKLNNLLAEKAREQPREIRVENPQDEHVKRAAHQAGLDVAHHKELIEQLTRDNQNLRNLLIEAQSATASHSSLREATNKLTHENERLNSIIHELRHEIEGLRKQATGNVRIDQLTAQTNTLLEENRRLNEALADRLREIDSLRVRIRDLEVGSANLTESRSKLSILTSENEKLNNIIAQLRTEAEKLRGQNADAHRVAQLTHQIDSLLDENKRLNDLVLTRSQEVDRLRKRIFDLESGANAHLELRDRVVLVTSENERLNALVVELRAETERLRRDASGAARIDQLKAELESLNRLVFDLRTENDRLKVQLSEAGSSGAKVASLTSQINALLDENQRLNALIVQLRADLEHHKHHASEHGANGARVDQLTNQLNLLLEENRRLNDLHAEKNGQIDRLKRMITEVEASAGAITELRAKLSSVLSENDRLNALVLELRAENEKLRLGASDAGRVAQLTSQLNSLLTENQRLSALLAERQRDLELLRSQSGDQTKISQLTHQINHLLEENKRLNDLLTQRAADLERARARIIEIEAGSGQLTELRGKAALLAAENERLTALVRDLHAETDKLRRQLADAGHGNVHVEQLTVQVNGLLDENRRLNDLLGDRLRESESLKRAAVGHGDKDHTIKDLRDKLAHLTSDIDRLNNIIADLRRENDSLRTGTSRSESLTLQINTLLDENRRLNEALTLKVREIDSLRSKSVTLETSGVQIASLEERIRGLTAEKDRVNASLLDRLREIDSLKLRISQLESLSSSTRELEVLRRALADKNLEVEELRRRPPVESTQRIELLLSENERLNGLLTAKAREVDNLRARIGDLERELGTERERWNVLLIEKQREIELLKADHNRTLETTALSDRDESVKRAAQKSSQIRHDDAIASLESRIRFQDDEIKRLTAVVLTRDRELAEIRSKVTEVEFIRQENERLNRLLTERIREIEELKHRGPGSADLEVEYKRLLNTQIGELTARFNEEKQGLLQRLREEEDRQHALRNDNERLTALNQQAYLDAENWKRKYEQSEKQRLADIDIMRQDYERRVRESPTRQSTIRQAGELEERVNQLSAEIERLQDHLNLTLSELDESRKKIAALEVNRAQEIDDLRQHFDNARRSNIEAKELSVKFAGERLSYETQIAQLQQTITDLEARISIINNENERYGRLSHSRQEEAEESRRKLNELKVSQNLELTQLRTQVESFKARNQDVKQLAIKYSADKAADQAQIRHLKQVNDNYKAEIEKLHELIEQSKTDFNSITKHNEELVRLYEKVSTEGVISIQEGGSTERYETLQREVKELEVARDEYRKQAQRNSTELTRRNKDLVDKLQELDVLKVKYEEALANYQALNNSLFKKLSQTA